MGEHGSRDILWHPSSRRDWVRYGVAACVVLAAVAGAATAADRATPGEVSSEVDDAVLLDLPPALASSAPPSDAADGPEQQATQAVAPVPPPEEVAPDTPQNKPVQDELVQDKPVQNPPPVDAAPAQEETAPAGSLAPVPQAEPIDSEAARRRAARAISRWQQAMLVRLEVAKSGVRTGGQSGTATIAFAIDRRGHLLTSRVARSSGSARLDQAALALLARAAPFPDPPAGSRDEALQFTVPVAFAARH